jgi:signal transduction histidine kinase
MRRLPVVNENCALRRNVAVQPYGRCSVCTLELRQCHAWQSSALSFALVVAILVPVFATAVWQTELAAGVALVLLLVQGVANHRRTDELIFGAHELGLTRDTLLRTNADLDAARVDLERRVAERTAALRETNTELARANLELAEVAARRERMVLEVSHDLRTPLTSIKGASQNLLDGIAGPLPGDQREYVEIVRDHADRLIEAVSRLLDAARAEDVRVEVALAPVDVGELARDVVRSLAPIAAERGLTVQVAGDAAPAHADAGKLRKVMENLLGNALKFTDSGGAVTVAVADDDADVRVTVEDTGVGMTREELDRAFDRFYRGAASAGGRPGTGLGLAISRDLVRLQGGEIVGRSEPGRGSAFSVLLPRGAA